jgi:hypothetical protein
LNNNIILYILSRGKKMIVFETIGDFFGSIGDWMNENLDSGGPIGAFIGVGLAVAACFIWA